MKTIGTSETTRGKSTGRLGAKASPLYLPLTKSLKLLLSLHVADETVQIMAISWADGALFRWYYFAERSEKDFDHFALEVED